MNQHVTDTPRDGSSERSPALLPLCVPSKLTGIAVFPKGGQVAKNLVGFGLYSDRTFFNINFGYVFIVSSPEFVFCKCRS